MRANVVMLSGCKDEQYSESSVFKNKWYGVMSYGFLTLVEYMKKYNVQELSIADFWRYMGIICNDFPQIPQASSSKNEFNNMKVRCVDGVFEIVKSQRRSRELLVVDESGETTTKQRSWNMTEPIKTKKIDGKSNYFMKLR